MHPDKKLGLALGILLIGVTGAFFFRNESPRSEPQLQDPQSLDDQISQQQGPKPHIHLERPEPIDDDNSPKVSRTWSPLIGSRQTDSSATTVRSGRDIREPDLPAAWTMPPDKIGKSAAPPDPISTVSRDDDDGPIPLPSGNREWKAVKSGAPATPTRTGRAAASTPSMRQHVVRRGETLSGLASRYLGSSARFEEIYRANRNVLRHPNDLRVGMTIRIPSRLANRTGSTQIRAAKSRGVQSSLGRARSNRRLPARSVSRETGLHDSGKSKFSSDRHRKHRSRFVPVHRSPLFWRLRRQSSEKSRQTTRKKLSQVPPTGPPHPSKN